MYLSFGCENGCQGDKHKARIAELEAAKSVEEPEGWCDPVETESLAKMLEDEGSNMLTNFIKKRYFRAAKLLRSAAPLYTKPPRAESAEEEATSLRASLSDATAELGLARREVLRLIDKVEAAEQEREVLKGELATEKAHTKILIEGYIKDLDALKVKVQELKARLKDLHRPTHGPCCTCQKCGKNYDDCRCSLDEVCEQLEAAEQRIKLLEKILDDALIRMERARSILTDNNPRPECNWGMLDSSDLKRRALLTHELPTKGDSNESIDSSKSD